MASLPLAQRVAMAAAAVKQWVALKDEDAMLTAWPDLLETFGADAIGAWRQTGKQKNAVVHLLTQHDEGRVLERVAGDGLSLDVQRKDGCTCLHLACWKDDYDLVGLLRDLGASEHIRNAYRRALNGV